MKHGAVASGLTGRSDFVGVRCGDTKYFGLYKRQSHSLKSSTWCYRQQQILFELPLSEGEASLMRLLIESKDLSWGEMWQGYRIYCVQFSENPRLRNSLIFRVLRQCSDSAKHLRALIYFTGLVILWTLFRRKTPPRTLSTKMQPHRADAGKSHKSSIRPFREDLQFAVLSQESMCESGISSRM